MSPRITVHAKIGCPYCESAKEFFRKKKLPITEIKYDPAKPTYEKEKQALVKKTNHTTFPQIFIGTKFVGGYSDLLYWEKQGKLDKALKANN